MRYCYDYRSGVTSAATSAAARWKIEYRSQFAQKCEWDSA